MLGNRQNKYNSRLRHWIGRLLPFDFNIEDISDTKMGLVGYILHQGNAKTKLTNIVRKIAAIDALDAHCD